MLAFVQRRFSGGGWSPGRNQRNRQLTVGVKPGGNFGSMKALSEVRKFAKKHRIIQMAGRSLFYEPPSTKKMREASERAYFAKWDYLKYCTMVVEYSLRNDLMFRTNVSQGCSNRLTQVCALKPVEPKSDGMSAEEIRNMAESFYGKA